jgi:hypothetical protein
MYFTAELTPEGLPARFGVITAFNPNGASAPESDNLQADLRLKHCLEQLSLHYFRVQGPNGQSLIRALRHIVEWKVRW